jgi:Tfp pilus assembly protein PilV
MGPCPVWTSSRGAEASARQARETLSPRGAALSATDAQAGFALIEVLISAVMLALIVVATFTGFDVANRASADERSRAQADVIAQQDEDRLRSFQIDRLSGLAETRTVVYGGYTYTVVSKGEFIADSSGSSSCSTVAEEASYVRTTSTVTWSGAGTRDPVVETGLITPPAGGALLVQVTNAKGAPVSGVTIAATGPASASAVTGPKGCVIFAALAEGTYTVTAHETGYIDKEGKETPELTTTIVPGTTDKKAFELDKPGAIATSFEPSTAEEEAKGDTFVAQNPLMPTPSYKSFGTPGTYATTVTSPTELFPFGEPATSEHSATGQYGVYAGTCEADNPEKVGAGPPKSVNVLPGETVAVKVPLPAINMQVFSGTSASHGAEVTEFSGSFKDEGCSGTVHKFSTSTATRGELHIGMPFGKFTLCVASTKKVGTPTAEYRKFASTVVENKSASGTSTYAIYLSASGYEHRTLPNEPYTCP